MRTSIGTLITLIQSYFPECSPSDGEKTWLEGELCRYDETILRKILHIHRGERDVKPSFKRLKTLGEEAQDPMGHDILTKQQESIDLRLTTERANEEEYERRVEDARANLLVHQETAMNVYKKINEADPARTIDKWPDFLCIYINHWVEQELEYVRPTD